MNGRDATMPHPMIDRAFYDSILQFDSSEKAQDTFYRVMNTTVESNGKTDTIRNKILRTYAMLFCDELGAVAGQLATPEDVEATADRLYVGELGYDPKHWYRMKHHFPMIDEDNYDRFAALVIADLSAGPLHEAALKGEDMLLVGELNPLIMSSEERRHQKIRRIHLGSLTLGGDGI